MCLFPLKRLPSQGTNRPWALCAGGLSSLASSTSPHSPLEQTTRTGSHLGSWACRRSVTQWRCRHTRRTASASDCRSHRWHYRGTTGSSLLHHQYNLCDKDEEGNEETKLLLPKTTLWCFLLRRQPRMESRCLYLKPGLNARHKPAV